MKIARPIRYSLYFASAALFATGAYVWATGIWFQIDSGFGLGPPAARSTALQAHGVFGLGFLILFGYLLSSHVRPGLRGRKRRTSGWTLLSAIGVLIVTTPILYYASNETLKDWASRTHSWVGLACALPFALHRFARDRSRART